VKRRRHGFSLVELMIVIAIISIIAAIGTVNFRRSRARAQYTACASNVKNIGTACEMYSKDNNGRYPQNTTQLTAGGFIKALPTCPSVGFSTYANGYGAASNPDVYTLVCAGTNHSGADIAANYPQYTARSGLVEQ